MSAPDRTAALHAIDPDARFVITLGASSPYLTCRWCHEWVCDIGDGDLLNYLIREAEEHRWDCHDVRQP